MKKFYVSSKDELNEDELKSGCVSYRRIIDRYIPDLVLCNEIANLDSSIDENINYELLGNEEIYQYFLCNITSFELERLAQYGIVLSYSNMLELNVLCVTHFGTSWDYVLTDVEWTLDINE